MAASQDPAVNPLANKKLLAWLNSFVFPGTRLPMAWAAPRGGAGDPRAGASARTPGTASVPPSARAGLGECRGCPWGCSAGLRDGQGSGAAVSAQLPGVSPLPAAGTWLVAFVSPPESPGSVTGRFGGTMVPSAAMSPPSLLLLLPEGSGSTGCAGGQGAGRALGVGTSGGVELRDISVPCSEGTADRTLAVGTSEDVDFWGHWCPLHGSGLL